MTAIFEKRLHFLSSLHGHKASTGITNGGIQQGRRSFSQLVLNEIKVLQYNNDDENTTAKATIIYQNRRSSDEE